MDWSHWIPTFHQIVTIIVNMCHVSRVTCSMTLDTCPNQAELVAAEANFCKLSSGVEDTQVIGSCSESEMKWNIILLFHILSCLAQQ